VNIAGIIPARYESSRFPGKPLASLRGKPVIRHVYERARRARELDLLIVATDDRRILEAVLDFGGEAILTRKDHASGTDRLAEAARTLKLKPDDMVINIQGDEPQVEPVMIQKLVEALKECPNCPMATLACESRSEADYLDPNVVKVVVNGKWKALYFSRSPLPFHRDGNGPPSFLKHLGFYAYTMEFLEIFTSLPPGGLELAEQLEQLRALENGHAIQVAKSPLETRGVDTPRDLQEIEAIFEALPDEIDSDEKESPR